MKLTQQQLAAVLFNGKTVTMVDASATNCWYFHFSDGTIACIDGGELKATLYSNGKRHEPEIFIV